MTRRRRRQSYCEAVKAAHLSFKSPQIVAKVRRELRDEGYTDAEIQGILGNVRILPDEETEAFLQ